MKTKLLLKNGRIFLTALALAGGLQSVGAQVVSTFPWTETFEEASPSRQYWTQVFESGAMSWTFTDDATTGSYSLSPYAGTRVANFPANSWNGEKTKLVSPVLNMAGMNNPTLQFYYVNPLWSTEQNILKVFYRTSAAGAWTEIAVFNSNIINWTSSGVVNLPNVNETYQIALEAQTLYGYSIMVDQLVVDGSLATAGFSTAHVKAYPNPSNGMVTISGSDEIQSVEVYNLSGQQILAKTINSTESQIDLTAFASGMYLFKINTPNASQTVKIVKQ